MRAPTRRQFLCTALVAGGAAGLGGAAWLATRPSGKPGESTDDDHALVTVERTARAFGSEVTVTVLVPDRATGEAAISEALAELETVEEVMSIYRPDSELSRLNREGIVAKPHPYFVEVLRHALEVSRASDGAFDVTVQPLWAVYSAAHRERRLPDDGAIAAARSLVDYRRLQVSPEAVRLDRPGAAITLNGIAQGFASDRAVAAVARHGARRALLNTGEIGTLGRRGDGTPWKVGIQHPRHPDAYVALARLDGRTLATSGDYATSFSPDCRYNHIFDPRTGHSPEELASASIAAATAMEADALSTAVFVLGPRRGLALVEATAGADAFFVLKDGRTLTTPGFPLET
jgi:thiamine biosynthesis lipoprotein